MVTRMNRDRDAYGQMLLAQLETGEELCEIIEREDNFIDTGSAPGYYFIEYKHWLPAEKQSMKYVRGRVLDIGCGAGRHSLYLQERGFDVTGIDNSPGAVKVCRARGLREAVVRPIEDLSKFKSASFDTVLMMGNNFGLVRSRDEAPTLLKELYRITSAGGRIIAGSMNPYGTSKPAHLSYHKLNRRRGRMPGQIRFRIRFGTAISDWFDYLLVTPEEMGSILQGTGWHIKKILGDAGHRYFAMIEKDLKK